MNMNSIRFKLTNSFWIRGLVKPYMDYKRKEAYNKYQLSRDSKYLKTLKDVHYGKRCFIIGNGPSLKVEDLEKLGSEYTFSANRIYKVFNKTGWRPTYYLAVDPNFIRTSWQELDEFKFGEMFLGTDMNFDMSVFKNKATRIFEFTK